jgi:hypothetical protein
VLFFEYFNLFKKGVCLVIELISFHLELDDFLVIFIAQILILLRLFNKFTRLVI